MQHFKLRYTAFPEPARGQVVGMTQQREGHCLIFIDSTAPEPQQAAALRHELAHVALDHGTDTRSIEQLEAEAESYAAQMKEADFDALMQWRISTK